MNAVDATEASRPAKASPWGFLGIGGLASLIFIDVASLLEVPWWVTVVLVVVGVVLFVLGCRWFVSAPKRVFWLAVAGVVVWLLVVVGGGLAFSWA